MIKRKLKRKAISPEDYQEGFNVAQREFEFFVQLKNRLRSIRATQQLKNGQLFLETIEVYQEEFKEDR